MQKLQPITILPTKYLSLSEDHNMFLALAHHVGKEEAYDEFFRQQAKRGKFVIMDNGVIETGLSPVFEVLYAKAEKIGASEIVLPDFFRDTEKTLSAICQTLESVELMIAQGKKMPKLMAVPQGDTVEEWLFCLEQIVSMDTNRRITTIGLPKVLAKLGDNLTRLNIMLSAWPLLQGREVHLLGCWYDPSELMSIASYVMAGELDRVNLRSCDSGIAAIYSQAGIKIDEDEKPAMPIKLTATDLDEEILQYNVSKWLEAFPHIKLQKNLESPVAGDNVGSNLIPFPSNRFVN